MLEGGIRALVRRNKLAVAAELIAEPTEDALIAGATSIADIGKLMEELETARDYLHYEGERLRQMTARYAHLAQTASASVKVIAQRLGKWRNAETASLEHPAMPGPMRRDLSPVDDREPLLESNDQVNRAGFETAWDSNPAGDAVGPASFLLLRVISINGFRERSSPRRGTRRRGAAHRTTTEGPHNPSEGSGGGYMGGRKNTSPVRGEPAAL